MGKIKYIFEIYLMCAVHYSDQWKSCQITELKFQEGFQVISYFLDFCSLSAVLLICIPHYNFSPPLQI